MRHILPFFLFLLFCAPVRVEAQNDTVRCVHSPQWDELLRRAREENKLIFLDCSASWCVPCKTFAKEVLTVDSVAAFFNSHFINVYVDLEKDKLPPVADMPGVRSIPALFFIDARQERMVHGRFGFQNAPALMRLAREAIGDGNIAAMRQRYLARQLDERGSAAFLQDLRECRLLDEFRQYLPTYLQQLTARSLQDSCVWAFCEQVMEHANPRLFQLVWNNRQSLFELYGEQRVMDKLLNAIDSQIAAASNWKTRRDSFSDSFQQLYDWISATELPGKQDYLLQIDAEKYAREGQTERLLSLLESAWKTDWDNDRKKVFIRKYIRKIYLNGTESEQKDCISLLEKFIKQTGDKGTKIDFLFTEKDIWERLGNRQKAQKADTLAQKLMNPHLFR